ncbi:MAG: hypothetical protein CUN53_17725 [Phototrophicales bacterium]|nr:MAG: hypothetical protein CUN53_17725 [Phototrophicales bacterium]
MLVSHDRYLVEALATQIWAVANGRLDVFKGTYDDYLAWRERQRASSALEASEPAFAPKNGVNGVKKTRSGLNPYQRGKRLAALEGEIHSLEARLSAIQTELSSGRADAGRVAALGVEYVATEEALHAAMVEWEMLIDEEHER